MYYNSGIYFCQAKAFLQGKIAEYRCKGRFSQKIVLFGGKILEAIKLK